LREWGELSALSLIPRKPTHKTRFANGRFVWNGNSIECIKYLNEREVSRNFKVQQKVFLNARQERPYRVLQRPEETGFDRTLKRKMLGLMNAKILEEKGIVEQFAKFVGNSEDMGKGTSVYNMNAALSQFEDLNFDDIEFPEHLTEVKKREKFGPRPVEMGNEFRQFPKSHQDAINGWINEAKANAYHHYNTPGPKKQESIHATELDDRTNAAFGFGKNTKTFTMEDLLKK